MKLLYFKKRKRERFSGAPLRYNWFSLIFWHPTPFLKYTFYSFQLKTCISVTPTPTHTLTQKKKGGREAQRGRRDHP